MLKIDSVFVVLLVNYLFIEYTDGIRVHEDGNENRPSATTQTILVPTAINKFDNLSKDSSRNLNATGTIEKVIKPNSAIFVQNGEKNKIGSIPQHQLNVSLGGHKKPTLAKHEPKQQFIPSPELIVDSSQSYESNEKFAIRPHRNFLPSSPINDHSHDIPTKNPSENPHSLEDYAKTNNAKQYTAGDGSVLTENDKLPWPIPYENAEKEFKWKTIQPETKSHQRTSDKLKQIVDLNANNWELASETTSFVPTISTNIQPLFTTALPSYHPYEFESIHAWSNIQPNADEHISENLTLQHDDFYARPIERQNETQTEFTNADHSTIPVERINKEVFWHTALKWLSTAIPIGLVLSAFAPNVVILDANTTTPYSPPIYPTPYASYLRTTTRKPLSVYASRSRIQQLTPDKQTYFTFLEKSKELNRVGSLSGATSCENRYLCELGLVALNEINDPQSAHKLYIALWRISNEQLNGRTPDDMDSIFTAIRNKECEKFLCTID